MRRETRGEALLGLPLQFLAFVERVRLGPAAEARQDGFA